jgi:MFS family permease
VCSGSVDEVIHSMKIAPQFLMSHNSYTNLELFGKNLGGLSTWMQLGIGVVGTLFFHVLSGVCLEHIFQLPGFHYGIFLTFSQFLIYTILAKLGQHFRGTGKRERELHSHQYSREAFQWYFIIALFMITTMGLTNHAMHYVPFTFIQLIKSGKLIPVMIGSKIVLNKSYSILEYLSAVLIGFGLSFLVLEKIQLEPTVQSELDDGLSHFYGFTLLLIALGMSHDSLSIFVLTI